MSGDNELRIQDQTFEGEAVLTFSNRISLPEPYNWGLDIIQILDDSYTNYSMLDLNSTQLISYVIIHESRITADNTILITIYDVTRYNVSIVRSPEDGSAADCLFYELDTKTSEIPIPDVQHFNPATEFGWDRSIPNGYFHSNSVDKLAYDGSGQNNRDFQLDNGLSLSSQLDAQAREVEGNIPQIGILDNGNSEIISWVDQIEGICVTINTETMKATLNQEYDNPQNAVYSTPKSREFSPYGSTVMTAQSGPGDDLVFSYRDYRLPWTKHPAEPPIIYMSWTRAPEHEAWKVFTGFNTTSLTMATYAERTGLETITSIPGLAPLKQRSWVLQVGCLLS
ncbi:ASST-domain-containing protein [Hypoxylon sp. FL1150]|nr:ASST-domain-containing protein [Hypoxylon sp. FL1150]